MSNHETTPYLIWIESLRAAVGCSDAELLEHRDMLRRWYHAGESVEIATPGLRQLVGARRRPLPVDDSIGVVRAAYRAAVKS